MTGVNIVLRGTSVTTKLVRLGFLIVALAALGFATPASAHGDDAQPGCRHVYGHYVAQPVPPSQCASAVGFCTAGQLSGALAGGYSFVMDTIMGSPQATTPGIVYYTGSSLITLRRGGSLVGTDNGVVDLGPSGKQAALVTITDGADGLSGAHGYLQLRGTLDATTGVVTGDYRGEICGM